MHGCMGIETEFGIAPMPQSLPAVSTHADRSRRRRVAGGGSGGAVSLLEEVIERVSNSTRARLRAAMGYAERSGYFLTNGSRAYRDGAHVEYATPEVTDPSSLVCHVLAGERMVLAGLSQAKKVHRNWRKVKLYKTNQSYGDRPASFGCHENYSYSVDVFRLYDPLQPFLCSRVIYTGAGGYDVRHPLRFSLSPRVSFLRSAVGGDSRALINGRDEALAAPPFRRLHILCGESSCSHLVMYLKVGTTAIVIAMAEAGINPGADVMPVDVMDAMRRFVLDPTCTVAVPVIGAERSVTAIDMQRAYLEAAQTHVGADWMPVWAPGVVQRWREVLELLAEGAPYSVSTKLDWAIKWSLHESFCRDRGFTVEQVQEWDRDISEIAETRGVGPGALQSRQADVLVNDPRVVRKLIQPHPLFEHDREHDKKWERLADALTLRSQLNEIDTRFAEIGPDGLFNQLDAAGVLEHRLTEVGEERICRAMEQPPDDTRARIRAEAIERVNRSRRKKQYRADWHCVYMDDQRIRLDLSELWNLSPSWRRYPRRRDELSILEEVLSEQPPGPTIDEVVNAYQRANFMKARALSMQLIDLRPTREHGRPCYATSDVGRAQRYLAWATARLGLSDPAVLLDRIHDRETEQTDVVGDYLFVYSVMALTPPPQIDRWIEKANMIHLRLGRSTIDLAEPLGYHLLCQGRLEAARRMLEPYAQSTEVLRGMRVRTNLFRIYLRMGDRDKAEQMLQQMNSRTGRRYLGLMAEYLLPCKAKLAEDVDLRRRLLRQAYLIHNMQNNTFGQVKINLLRTRACGDGGFADDLRHQIIHDAVSVPTLHHCKKFDHIQRHWRAWSMTDEPDEHGDYWWGL